MDWQAQEAAAHLSAQHGGMKLTAICLLELRDGVDEVDWGEWERCAAEVVVSRPSNSRVSWRLGSPQLARELVPFSPGTDASHSTSSRFAARRISQQRH